MAASAIDDEALREWKKTREVERLNAQQKQESNETVWIPIELMVVVHSLWERVKIEPESDPYAHDIKVWAAFLKLVSETTPDANNTSNTLSPASRQYLMRVAFDNFVKSLRGTDIHAATRGLPEQQALQALGAPAEHIAAAAHRKSALLTLADDGRAGIFATFGGQGATWLPELRLLMSTYLALRPLIQQAQAALSAQVTAIKAPELYAHGVDFTAWAADASSAPPADYLASAPISWPMIGLTQLLHYHVGLLVCRASPAEMLKRFKGLAGHSQGSTAAVVASLSGSLEELAANTVLAVRLLASIGARLQQATPFQAGARADIAQESVTSGWGTPTPMLSVAQLPAERLKKYVDAANKTMAKDDPERLLEIALRNGPRNAVVVGHPEALHALNKLLHQTEAGRGAANDQTRVPFSKRQLEFRSMYLNVSVPFHSALLLQGAAVPLTADVRAIAPTWTAASLRVPVYSTVDGSDMRKSADLLTDLIRMQTVQPVDWPAATSQISAAQGVTHVVDFGPGTGSGNTLARNVVGQGVQVILAGINQAPDEGAVGAACGKWALFGSRLGSLPVAPHWAVQYAPKLVRRECDGKLIVYTRMSALLGKPPLMVAGMTPTTVTAPIVAAALNAGYHAELAGGGLPSEKMYKDRIAEVINLAAPGWAVTPNLLFLNQRLWGFQFPNTERLASEGWPIEGLTVAAGVPSAEKTAEIVVAVEKSGMLHLGFKPGSAASILQVVELARAHPGTAIILQWTGGRGGGHHSFEDMHEPILAMYSEIRTCANITLVAGSGFGDAEDSWPYLSGIWSVPLGYAAMPFDGVLVGSRVMVSKEAATAREAKELLVQTPGIEKEAQWEQSYEGIAGGVVTVRSELGEPIHKVATRGLLLWREMDREIFTLPAEKAAAKIAERKEYIIRRLNADYQKGYFGRHLDGAVCDLDEMTYEEVARRLLELSFVPISKTSESAPAQGRWLHADYMTRMWDLGVRIEERFAVDVSKGSVSALTSCLSPQAKLNATPQVWVDSLFSVYGGAKTQLLCSEDVDWFIALCRQGGRKPVNFVPVIDRDLESWFKKDSLWQSEDLDAVPNRDVGRVVILQGPVSVRYSRTVDEPVADILNGIHEGWIKRLLGEKAYSTPESIPVVEYIGGPAARSVGDAEMTRHRVVIQRSKKDDTELLSAQLDERSLPEKSEWIEWLAGPKPTWWRALLTASHIVRGNRRATNYVRSLFEPRARTRLEIARAKGHITEVNLFDTAVLGGKPTLRVTCTPGKDIAVTLFHARPSASEALALSFRLQYHPEQGTSPLHEADPDRKARVKRFYADMWLTGTVVPAPVGEPKNAQFTTKYVINRPNVEAFVRSIGRPVLASHDGSLRVPLDFAIVAGWEAIMRALLSDSIEGDVLQLVHASNALELLAARGLKEGDQLTATAKLHELAPIDAGTRVIVDCVLALQDGATLASLRSAFLFRGEAAPKGGFRRTNEARWVTLQTKEQLAVLCSKTWITWSEEPKVGDRLVFRINSTEDVLGGNRINVNCTGTAHRAGLRLENGQQVGTISHVAQDVFGDVATAFVRRFGRLLALPVFFESGGYAALQTPDVVSAPADNSPYAVASTDFNPIHTNPYFASIAALPATVTHGMWASANARRVVESSVAKHRPERISSFSVDFVGYVKPRDRLTTHVRHIGMRSGSLLLEVRTENAAGEPVVKGKAEVKNSTTAYVFTGQGSAEVGMGMDLYAASPLARRIWNTADAFLLERYGFSILQIVRDNPKSIELTFGGTRGEAMRANYKSLHQEVSVRQPDGTLVSESRPLFQDITDLTSTYTFSHPEGLLFATQFSQPALVLFELAAFEDMRERSLVPEDCFFAGHSLGEYAALASVASVLSLEALAEIVFLRGITMQNAVQRDKLGRSQYAMVAVNPARVHPSRFREPQLQQVIAAIVAVRPELLQVVNYNVDNYQYVVAGERGNLRALSYILDEVRKDPVGATSRMEAITKGALQAVDDARDPESGWIELERGTATIPLPGIDVPFHSRFLANGVPAFRQILIQRVAMESIDERKLVGRYIPNVTATPFSLSKEYVALVHKDTQSPELAAVLADFDNFAKNPQKLAHTLVLELLAYQFASPVRWIETQHLFFTSLQVERLIEVGPAPTLLTMAKRTLEQGSYSPLLQREILWYNRDKQAIYYQHADEAAPATAAPEQQAPAPAAQAKQGNGPAHKLATPTAATAAPVQQASAAARVAAPAGKSVSAPLTALEVLRTMLALKLKRSLPLVPPTTSIREAVGGKSALQNELIGDVAKEFGSEPEGAADMDLTSLAARFPNYARLGALMAAQVGRMVAAKLPGGLAGLRTQLSQQYGFTDETVDAVLVHMLTAQPAQRLQTEGEANQWLSTVATEFAQARGIALPTSGGGAVEGGAVAVVDSAALAAAEKKQQSLAREHLRALQAYIGDDSPAAQQLLTATEAAKAASEAALKQWQDEHGEAYGEGIRPVFDAKKERRYSSFWNWALQDCLTLYYDYACGRATRWGNDIRERLYHIKNRASPRLVTNIQFYLHKAEQDGRPEITRFIHILIDVVRASMDEPPKYRELALPTAPVSEIDPSGVVRYKEANRPAAKDMSGYVQQLSSPAPLAAAASAAAHGPKEAAAAKLLESLKNSGAKLDGLEAQLRELCGAPTAAPPQVFLRTPDALDPSAHIFDATLSNTYLSVLQKVASEGITFQKKVALVTGCGKGSIGLEIVKGLLRGGAKVYATTSRWSPEGFALYNSLYDDHGGKFSELVVLPFNQASQQDVQALVDYIYEKEKEDLDFIVPFAAMSENGRDLGGLDAHSELAHRLMLTNLLRLVGAVKNKKEAKKIVTHPAHVLLPLSPNHGIFGSDGLYAESKLGLEALLNKWHSESWSSYLTLAGAVIGWTRGTALMQSNNVLAAGIEKLGARTFSTKEMCFNLLGLLHPQMVSEAQRLPLWADLNGSLHLVRNLHTVVADIRSSLQENAALHKAVALERGLDQEVAQGPRTDTATTAATNITPRANVRVAFPDLPSETRLADLAHLRGMLDMDKVIVVVGFGEVGPFGSARTRWEMEAFGEFSLEGCIELAWSMGLIKYHKDAQWTGWVDAKTKDRVRDHLVKSKYEETLLRHTGIRVVEPGMHEGYDPLNKQFLHTVALDKDGPEVECSPEDARNLKQQHGERVDIITHGGTTFFRLRKGAVMYVPKSMRTDRFVAGQVPTTWDPAVFGVPADIIAQVDRVTLYALVSVVESMVAAGISDPYEFYQYIHVSEIANTIGAGLGGANAIKRMHIDRLYERPVQADVLQETFINTMPAWLNLLLLSASGPIKTPVGACATAVESVDLGIEAIRSGKARIAFVGGYDDYGEHGAYEFAQMKATINNEADMAAGRTAREQSRPATSTRAGFVEAHGAGTQILMSASLAVKMGVPIYAVLEHVATAMDKIGRSVPAPGRGILTTARESSLRYPTPLLDIAYRKRQLEADLAAVKVWAEREREAVQAEITAQAKKLSPEALKDFTAEQEKVLVLEHTRRLKSAHAHWGNEFYVGNPHIAPLRGALAVYGLTIDDIAVASFHGTSTKGNDYNESHVLQNQLEHLGRTPGNLTLSIWQKYLTGHPKGAAAAWMMNGLIQSMLSGVVPGNRNADNIDAALQKFEHLVFLNRSLHTYGFKAGLLKSFGFGQVGGEVLVIHPDYVLAQLEPEAFSTYTRLRATRNRAAFRHWQDALVSKAPFVRVKNDPPYVAADEQKVLLNPLARAQYSKEHKTWRYAASRAAYAAAAVAAPPVAALAPTANKAQKASEQNEGGIKRALSHTALTHLEVTLRELQHGLRDPTLDRGLGVDAQLISEIEVSISNSDFVARNFTAAEIAYCRGAADPSSSFAGRWAAKEAIIKAISSSDTGDKTRNLWAGGSAPLRDIEVLPSASGAPKVELHGYAKEVATLLGISSIKVSISHSGEYAIAQAVAR